MLIRLIENWKQSLGHQTFVGAVLMDLSEAFDCIPYDFLIAKMHAYGFSIDSLKIFFSYLKGRKQNVKINNTYSVFQVYYLEFHKDQFYVPFFSTFSLMISYFGLKMLNYTILLTTIPFHVLKNR